MGNCQIKFELLHLIYGVAAVGMVMCCIPVVQFFGVLVVGFAAGLYAYKHREEIKNTASSVASYVKKSIFFEPVVKSPGQSPLSP